MIFGHGCRLLLAYHIAACNARAASCSRPKIHIEPNNHFQDTCSLPPSSASVSEGIHLADDVSLLQRGTLLNHRKIQRNASASPPSSDDMHYKKDQEHRTSITDEQEMHAEDDDVSFIQDEASVNHTSRWQQKQHNRSEFHKIFDEMQRVLPSMSMHPNDSWAGHMDKLLPESMKLPSASYTGYGNATDIWKNDIPWMSMQDRHPRGVASNVWTGDRWWAPVNYLNIRVMVAMSLIAYPVLFMVAIVVIMLLVSFLMFESEESHSKPETHCYLPNVDYDIVGSHTDEGTRAAVPKRIRSSKGYLTHPSAPAPPPCGDDYAPPVLSRSSLTPFSQKVYKYYAFFCCSIPSIMVVGVPVVLMLLYIPYPQESFCVVSILTSVAVFTNGIHMVIFASCSLFEMQAFLPLEASDNPIDTPLENTNSLLEVAQQTSPSVSKHRITHWVILPQYLEHIEVVSLALASLSQSSVARSSVSVVLAMEKREQASVDKAAILKERFSDCFAEMLVTLHPSDLPNDPAGKASNLKWAYDCLLAHLWSNGQGFSDILLTVADADSEFHERYFEYLEASYLEVPLEERGLRIFQAPIFHIKNYHRQPSPVIVGTMFTTMQELATTCDPNVTQFPYSTYSLPLELARRVGGFDPEWIAEDWHMGIKCFLLTFGQARVQSLMIPICNFTPEDETWCGTVFARWAQAKRHALGFSDLSYIFMMFPLIYAYASSKTSQRSRHLKAFWIMLVNGLRLVNRIISVHVIIGVITPYGILQLLFRCGMEWFMPHHRYSMNLWSRTDFWFATIFIATIIVMLMVTTLFNIIYLMAHGRIEKCNSSKSFFFRYNLIHWLYTALCFLVFGPFYFAGLAYAVWRAAILMLVSPTFEYEVAMKRTVNDNPKIASGRDKMPPASAISEAASHQVVRPGSKEFRADIGHLSPGIISSES
jgi:hypothetical protein